MYSVGAGTCQIGRQCFQENAHVKGHATDITFNQFSRLLRLKIPDVQKTAGLQVCTQVKSVMLRNWRQINEIILDCHSCTDLNVTREMLAERFASEQVHKQAQGGKAGDIAEWAHLLGRDR